MLVLGTGASGCWLCVSSSTLKSGGLLSFFSDTVHYRNSILFSCKHNQLTISSCQDSRLGAGLAALALLANHTLLHC